MQKKTILVTGGAGYIGSHVVKQLGEMNERIVVVDNLSTGSIDNVVCGSFVEGDSGDRKLIRRLIQDYDIDSVLHFAAHTIVPESIGNPLKYYRNNTACTRNLLECCQEAGIEHFIFSSTAAVYGMPEGGKAAESSPTAPISPYGTSKLMSEWMLRDLSAASSLRHVTLRYFNVAGCDPDGAIGQLTRNATLLIKVAAEVAVGLREKLYIYGTDYPTKDGTGVRDYIHVSDLADAHIHALEYLRSGGQSITLNCGYGHGYTVREVIDAVNTVNGHPLPVEEVPRRPGDSAELVAEVKKIYDTFRWRPRHDDLIKIVQTSLAWERKLLSERAEDADR